MHYGVFLTGLDLTDHVSLASSETQDYKTMTPLSSLLYELQACDSGPYAHLTSTLWTEPSLQSQSSLPYPWPKQLSIPVNLHSDTINRS